MAAFWYRLRRQSAAVLGPLALPAPGWAMAAEVSVNPELLKRFGLQVPNEPSYPGLADSIIARKVPAGVPANVDNAEVGYSREALASAFAALYQAVDLDCPNMRVLSVDPPVLLIENFLGTAECDALMANTPPLLQQSTIGAGKLFAQGTELSERRTSTSVLLEESILAARPSVAEPTKALQDRAKALFPAAQWGATGKLPPPGSVCFEALQVARYEAGQYFKDHQDAFPLITARRNQFQRLATVLTYLNNVPEGGETRFPHLDLAVKPKKGAALVFFPGFADGRPDDRMLHEALPAVDPKWVAQQWVSVGVAPGSSIRVPSNVMEGLTERTQAQAAAAPAAGAAADVAAQEKQMKAKMRAMEEHNARAVELLEEKKKQAAVDKARQERKSKKSKVNDALGPKRGFGV